MKVRNIISISMILVILVLGGCSTGTTKKESEGEKYDPKINPKDFVETVDNEYFTLTPGKRFVYEGESEEGTERIEVTVTSKTKKVMGVITTVVRDTVWLEGELAEDTYDWFAQDKEGNVWYLGEDSKEYKKGKVVSNEGSWEAGVDGAKPGIVMPANPKVGDSYRQEYYKGEAEDMGDIVAFGEKVTVPYGTYENCLKTRDWSKIETDQNEYKYYSSDVGFVILEKEVEGKEKVELIDITTE